MIDALPRLLGVLMLALAGVNATAHPDKVEPQLLMHFATGVHRPANGQWRDLTHRSTARIMGGPVLTNIGPAQALRFDGEKDYLLVAETLEQARPLLPEQEFSVAAWVLLRDTIADGGICGLIQDNGSYEKGWLLGYDRRSFTLTLSTEGANQDGDGQRTALRGRTAIEPERWYYVAATYDGGTMRLYVNGQLDGESGQQSGRVLYPERGRFAVAAYIDDDEFHPMEGALAEVKSYARVLTASEVEEVAQRNQPLIEYRSPVNTVLQLVVKPYLQFGTANSMTVMCETSQPSEMVVEYGQRQPLSQRVAARELKHIHEVTITELQPNTMYFYRVTCTDPDGNIARSDVYSFQTAVQGDRPYAFGIVGDTQRNPDVTRRCAEGIFALRPNFTLHLGDVVDDGFAKHQWVSDLFEPCSRLFAYVPVFPVIGNHEKDAHWYYDYFSLPKPEYWYTFTYGNAQFFMIDSNKDCGPGSDQYQWLERELARSTATWKFTCHHHPCFSSDEDDYGDQWKGKQPYYTWGDNNARRLVPLYETYGVDVAFAGHIHSYERTWPIFQMSVNQKKGVRYIVSGGGGGGLEQAAPQRAWFTVHVQRSHHYCFATVHDRTIQFKAYDLEGRLFDTFELTKDPDR